MPERKSKKIFSYTWDLDPGIVTIPDPVGPEDFKNLIVKSVLSSFDDMVERSLRDRPNDTRIEITYGGWYYDNGSHYYTITGYRPETDEEMTKRLAREDKQAENRKKQAEEKRRRKEEKDKKEYERLKKKFGD